MISRRSSGSKRTDSAVEPTRSQNMMVRWRRSAAAGTSEGSVATAATGAAGTALPRSAAIAASSRRRSPTAATPISFRSSAVSSGRTSQLIAFSAKAGAYRPRPRPCSHSAMSTVMLPSPTSLTTIVRTGKPDFLPERRAAAPCAAPRSVEARRCLEWPLPNRVAELGQVRAPATARRGRRLGRYAERRHYQGALEQVELADRVGIDYVWEVEQHFLEAYSH